MRHLVDLRGLTLGIDSAGTGGWHAGDPPDARMIDAAAQRGIDLSRQRARKVLANDFHTFTHIFAMDAQNLSDLQAIAPADATAELTLFLGEGDVPDPYYGGPDGFEHVLDLVETRCAKLLEHLGRT